MSQKKITLHQPVKNPWILAVIALIIIITFVSLYVNKAPGAGQAISIGGAQWTGGTVDLEREGSITFTALPATRQDLNFTIGTSLADPQPLKYNFSLIKLSAPNYYRFIVSTSEQVVLAVDTLYVGGTADQSLVYLNEADATPELEVSYSNGQIIVRNLHYLAPESSRFTIINSTGSIMPIVIRLPEGVTFTGLINASSVLAPENLNAVLSGAGTLVMNDDPVRNTEQNYSGRTFTYTAPAAFGLQTLTLRASVQSLVTEVNYTLAIGNFQKFYGAVSGLSSGQVFRLVANITGNSSQYRTPVINAQYGRAIPFYVQGQQGQPITFYAVNSSDEAVVVGTATYQNTAVSRLDLLYVAPATSGGTGGTTARCGNNVREGSEACDGTDLAAGQSCVSQVGIGSTGTLSCTTTCTFNISQCSTVSAPPTPPAVCWQCNDWRECRNGRETRSCVRYSPCTITGPEMLTVDPATEKSCRRTNETRVSAGPSSCLMSWECGAWSLCRNSQQSRICFRADNCDTLQAQGQVSSITSTPKPREEQNCQEAISPGAQQLCTAGMKRCLGSQLQLCSTDGSQWATLQTCPSSCDPISLTCRTESAVPPGPIQKPSPTWIYLLISSIVLVLIIVGLAVVLLNKKKYAPAKEYIQESRERGMADEQIREKLVEEGWDEKGVGRLFK